MTNGFERKRVPYPRLHAALLACALATACGDDSRSDSGDDGVAPECTPGRTETGCMCSTERPPGSRHCDDEGMWEACVCPPAQSSERCSPGQEVLCFLCPGERERRRTTCLSSGTFDCSCKGDGPPPDDDAGR